jgi:anti-sigma factor RsiW
MTTDSASADCPETALLASLADGTLSDVDRTAVAAHVGGCDRCLEQVGALVRLAREPAPALPPSLKARVALPRRADWRAVAAMAAAVCLSLGAWFYVQQPVVAPYSAPRVVLDAVRSGDYSGQTPVVRHPEAGQRVPAGALAVEWQPVSQAVSYRVRILRDDGQLLWEGESQTARLEVPAAAALPTDAPLYVTVAALLPDARTSRSPSTPFTLIPR